MTCHCLAPIRVPGSRVRCSRSDSRARGEPTLRPVASAAAETCGHSGCSYAGYQSAVRARGIAATLSAASVPSVASGHAAAWVGVSLPHAGQARPAWLQVGLASFAAGRIRLYVEVAQPTTGSRYREIVANVPPGSAHRVAVVELPRRRTGGTRSWTDTPSRRPSCSRRSQRTALYPIATAETWTAARRPATSSVPLRARVSAIQHGRAWRPVRPRLPLPGTRAIASCRSARRASFLARGIEARRGSPRSLRARQPRTLSGDGHVLPLGRAAARASRRPGACAART